MSIWRTAALRHGWCHFKDQCTKVRFFEVNIHMEGPPYNDLNTFPEAITASHMLTCTDQVTADMLWLSSVLPALGWSKGETDENL